MQIYHDPHIQTRLQIWTAMFTCQLGIFLTNNALIAFSNEITSTEFVHHISKLIKRGEAAWHVVCNFPQHLSLRWVRSSQGSCKEMSRVSREWWDGSFSGGYNAESSANLPSERDSMESMLPWNCRSILYAGNLHAGATWTEPADMRSSLSLCSLNSPQGE